MTSRSSGQVSVIKGKAPTEGHKTMFFFVTGDGTSNEHKQVMKEKGLAYAMVIRNSTMQRGECNMAYGAYYLPSLAYGTPANTLSYKECEDVEREVVAAILIRMGIVRNAARKVMSGSAKYSSLGLDHLAIIQNYSCLQYLIVHIRSKSITSKLIRQQLYYTQLEIGCSAQVLGQDYNRYSQAILCLNWITAIWESLHACKAPVAINSDWIPQPARIGDMTIMEELTGSVLVNKRDLTDIKRCRVYLRVFFLSDIVNIQGDTIEEWALTGELSNARRSTWHSQVQQKPPITMWNKWKASLIAVFNDETTLTAPMGDWLHKQNYQESEWWLSVQEKCIYRQNSGEWSQFSQLSLGRLWFSTTHRIVPQPNGLSHRIQVTQRAHYHEVAAKVNIIRRSNMGPTRIHNYTSGIGLSFLALPRHIQRLTGDILALPTPAPFDFDEPVELIIATYGSVLFGVGYHGWVLSTKEEKSFFAREDLTMESSH
jgi:hypothetical protein